MDLYKLILISCWSLECAIKKIYTTTLLLNRRMHYTYKEKAQFRLKELK